MDTSPDSKGCPACLLESSYNDTPQDQKPELLPCPHCHKTTEDKEPNTEQRAVTPTTYTPENACVVQCNWCGLSGPIFGTIDEAIEAWNKLSDAQKEIERLNKWKEAILDAEPNLKEEGLENIWGYFVHWNEIIERCCMAWPNEKPGYSESPIELITRIIDERDELKQTNRLLEANVAEMRALLVRSKEMAESRLYKDIDAFLSNNSPGQPILDELAELKNRIVSIEFENKTLATQNKEHEKDYLAVWKAIKKPDETVVEAATRVRDELERYKKALEQVDGTLIDILTKHANGRFKMIESIVDDVRHSHMIIKALAEHAKGKPFGDPDDKFAGGSCT